MLTKLLTFHRRLVKPAADDQGLARQELILNVLLIGSWYLTSIAFIFTSGSWIYFKTTNQVFHGISPWIILGISVLLTVFFFLSKKGHHKLISQLFIFILWLPAAYASYRWGALLVQAVLMYALVIVFTAILISTRASLLVTILNSVYLILITALQFKNKISYSTSWRARPPDVGNAVTASFTLFVISLVTWLATREMHRALHRALISEQALQKERDALEKTVQKRTQQLRDAQAEKMLDWYRFVELGKSAAEIFHDVRNPLSSVSLNLEQIHSHNQLAHSPDLDEKLTNAFQGLEQINQFINLHQQQIKKEEVKTLFAPTQVIKQALKTVTPQAQKNAISLKINCLSSSQVFGNKTRFYQILLNLLANAIEACQLTPKNHKRTVSLSCATKTSQLIIKVADSGVGIPKKIQPLIFEPLFSTKQTATNFGLGLNIVKTAVTESFGGQLSFTSKQSGTIFTLKIPI